jgi:FlaA1/EpsC-like NDP-sugar epimerase
MLADALKRIINYRHRWIFVMFFHALLVTIAFATAFLIRFDFNIPAKYFVIFYSRLPVFVAVQLIVLGCFHLYSGMWRFVSALDIWNITKANTVAMVICVLVEVTVFGWQGFPRSIFIIDGLLCIGLMSGVRILTRLFREGLLFKNQPDLDAKRILIVGAGSAGVILLGEYRRNPHTGSVVGFIDDDRLKINEHIQGVKILGRRQDIPRVVKENRAEEIILAIPSATGEVVRDVLSYCEQTRARIKVVPGLVKIISGEMEVKPRDVHPDDLLGRETVTIETQEVEKYIKDKVVLVTGAGGSIGSEICRQVAAFGPKKLILLDHHENQVYFLTVEFKTKFPRIKIRTVIGDIRDVGLVRKIFIS